MRVGTRAGSKTAGNGRTCTLQAPNPHGDNPFHHLSSLLQLLHYDCTTEMHEINFQTRENPPQKLFPKRHNSRPSGTWPDFSYQPRFFLHLERMCMGIEHIDHC